MRNKLDKLRIELYINGVFQGYVKSVSMAKQRVTQTPDKRNAKTYGSFSSASSDADRIAAISHGTLLCSIV